MTRGRYAGGFAKGKARRKWYFKQEAVIAW